MQFDLKPTNEQRLLRVIEKEIRNASLVIISDYGYGTISKRIADKILEEGKRKKINIFVSSVGHNYLKYRSPETIIKINTRDSLLLINESENKKLEPSEILERLHDLLDADRILLTREREGIAIYDNGVITEKPATRDEPKDVKGIGEVMTATICSRLLMRRNFEDSCELGNVAAGLAVSRGNIESISEREIIEAQKEYDDWADEK
jgi:bifunctional ADP-heptose synthase (sugar kinase/adenylyltransferase)